MDKTFSTVVVPLDLESDGDRAIDVARCLAALGNLPIELVCVLPKSFEHSSGVTSLDIRARRHDLTTWTPVVLVGDDPATAVVDHLRTLAAPLVVMATAAHSLLGELISSNESARLLTLVQSPVLVIGPHVAKRWTATAPTLLACVGPSSEAEPLVSVMARWLHTFGGASPWFVEVLTRSGEFPEGDDLRESMVVQRRAEGLAQLGLTGEWEVLHGDDPVDAIESFAEGIDEPLTVVDSEHWTDPSRIHLHSVARRMAHRSRQPVLIIPTLGSRHAA